MLLFAVEQNKLTLIEAALKHGEDPNMTNQAGDSALLIVVMKEQLEGASLLLQFGADPNKANLKGLTPIAAAEELQNPELLSLLNQAPKIK